MNTVDLNYKVSVITTMYNSREYILRAITSILKQTFSGYELILVDDGSTDNTEEIVFPLLKVHDNFKFIRHPNRKHPLSLNTGIINSTGEYITFLDSDDEYDAAHLEQRVKFFTEHADIDLIFSPATIIGDETDCYVPDVNDNSKLIHLDQCIIGGTLFGKRKVFLELNGFKNIYSHDSDFYNRATKKFKVKHFDSHTYIYYRNNPNSVINKLKQTVL